MSSKNDQIFQLSLTEIAFTISFMLMLLLGLMVVKTTKENERLMAQLTGMGNVDTKLAELEGAKSLFVAEVKSLTSSNPEELISKLVEASKARDEVAKLKKLLKEQDDKITALTEIQKAIEQVAGEQGGSIVKEKVEEALLLASSLKESLEKTLANQDEKSRVDEIGFLKEKANESIVAISSLEQMLATNPALSALQGKNTQEKLEQLAKEYEAFNNLKADPNNPLVVKKENVDLKGQVQYLKNRLDAKGGMDFPPCWADEKTGKVQMLLTLELREGDLSIQKAWPEIREADAMALPGMQQVLANPVSSYEEFLRSVKPISDMSRTLSCRHYVRLKSSISDAVQSDRRRLMIEDYFYKLEVRR